MKEEEIIKGTCLFQHFQTLSQHLVFHDLTKYYREDRLKKKQTNKEGPASLSQRSLGYLRMPLGIGSKSSTSYVMCLVQQTGTHQATEEKQIAQ